MERSTMLDWSKLKPYHSDKRRSFEELCYQIAKCLFHDRFTRIDDTGGGDGVEFYMVLPDGNEWGWQAKFYYPDGRLIFTTESPRLKNPFPPRAGNIRDSRSGFCAPQQT
jgi:hypothetical protein